MGTINQWFHTDADPRARVQEAVVRGLMCALLRPVAPASVWVNTAYDEIMEPEEDMDLLRTALCELDGGSPPPHEIPALAALLAEACCAPTVVDAVVTELQARLHRNHTIVKQSVTAGKRSLERAEE